MVIDLNSESTSSVEPVVDGGYMNLHKLTLQYKFKIVCNFFYLIVFSQYVSPYKWSLFSTLKFCWKFILYCQYHPCLSLGAQDVESSLLWALWLLYELIYFSLWNEINFLTGSWISNFCYLLCTKDSIFGNTVLRSTFFDGVMAPWFYFLLLKWRKL